MKDYLIVIGLWFLFLIFLAAAREPSTPSTDLPIPTDFTCVGTDGTLTDGITLATPIPVTWDVQFGECLVGDCSGATFTKKASDEAFGEFPDFIGYYDVGEMYDFKKGEDVRLHGKLREIYTDKDALSIQNRCVPIVQIQKIESL